MVAFCCVVGCCNRSNRDRKQFFRLPIIAKSCRNKSKAELLSLRRKQWLNNINRIDLKNGDSNYSPGYIRVCSDHFYTGKPSKLTDVDHPDWAPTLNMGKDQVRVKGSREKKIIFSALRVKGKQINFNAKEVERRRKLAQYTESYSRKRSYYCRKAKKEEIARNDKRQLQPRIAKKTYMKRKMAMHTKMSSLNTPRNQEMGVPTGFSYVMHPSQTSAADSTQTKGAHETEQSTKSAIIHKIQTDCVLPDENRDSALNDNSDTSPEHESGSTETLSQSLVIDCSYAPIEANEYLLIDQIMNEHLQTADTKDDFETKLVQAMGDTMESIISENKEEMDCVLGMYE